MPLWLAIYHHRSTLNEPLDFTRRPWLAAIYRDQAPYIVVKKASQVCITEWALCTMLAAAMQGHPGIYILPTDRVVYEFTPRRIDRLIERVPFYAEYCVGQKKSSDTKTQKTLFGTDWNIVGANVAMSLHEKPADVLIFDELDWCNQDNLKFAIDRLSASKSPTIRMLGNPTTLDGAINREYEESDKKQWFVKCLHCNEWQTLTWFANVLCDSQSHMLSPQNGSDDLPVHCCRCHKPIDRLGPGEWIAEHKDRAISGYHVSQIIGKLEKDVHGLPPIRSLLREFTEGKGNPSKEQHFYNTRLGLAYTAKGARIDEQMLAECADAEYTMPLKAENTVAGVDTGNLLHVHISMIKDGKRVKVFVGTVPDYNELDRVARLYGVVAGVIDPLSDLHAARKFIQDHPGWYACYYTKESDEKMTEAGKQGKWLNMGAFKYNPVARTVSANRTESLDLSLEDCIKQRVVLPQNYQALDNGDYVKQMCVPTRVKKERSDGTFRYIWTKGEDHHRHADNYDAIAGRIYRGAANFVVG